MGQGSPPPVPASHTPRDSELAQDQLQRERGRLRLLLDVSNAVVPSLSLKDLLIEVSACLRQFFNHDFASVFLYDEETGQLRLHALDEARNRTGSDSDRTQLT